MTWRAAPTPREGLRGRSAAQPGWLRTGVAGEKERGFFAITRIEFDFFLA